MATSIFMSGLRRSYAMCLLGSLVILALQSVDAAPGEDPIVVNRPVRAPVGPVSAQPRSAPLNPVPEMPAWLAAKVARLEAKAWGYDVGNLITDRNLQASASSDGLRKVCIQDIGSAVAGASGTAGSGLLRNTEPQLVVLKGDVVNICR